MTQHVFQNHSIRSHVTVLRSGIDNKDDPERFFVKVAPEMVEQGLGAQISCEKFELLVLNFDAVEGDGRNRRDAFSELKSKCQRRFTNSVESRDENGISRHASSLGKRGRGGARGGQ